MCWYLYAILNKVWYDCMMNDEAYNGYNSVYFKDLFHDFHQRISGHNSWFPADIMTTYSEISLIQTSLIWNWWQFVQLFFFGALWPWWLHCCNQWSQPLCIWGQETPDVWIYTWIWKRESLDTTGQFSCSPFNSFAEKQGMGKLNACFSLHTFPPSYNPWTKTC